MSARLKATIKARVRAFHNEQVELSKSDPVIPPVMAFHEGYKSGYPGTTADTGRKMRRAMERQLLKKVTKK